MKKRSKRLREILKNSIKDKKINAQDALEVVKKNSKNKCDEYIDVTLKINIKHTKDGDVSLIKSIHLHRD